jgi:dTDP-4-amino-4,6-dideoxygalactose transaminase
MSCEKKSVTESSEKEDTSPIYVTEPSLPPLNEFQSYLESIWKSKVLTNGGPFHSSLEQALCNYLGVKYISLFSNGTLALITALRALDIEGEVITTPYSFIATAHSLLWNRIEPVFIDIDPQSLNMSTDKIEDAITNKTQAILPVHCYGTPCDTEGIKKVAIKNDLKIIYDAAHAFGVKQNNKSILLNGDLSVVSFHATKVFNTFEGGAIISHTPEMKRHIDNLKNFGIVDEVTVSELGINGKMSELNAALGLLQLKYIDEKIEHRARVDRLYRKLLFDIVGIECLERNGSFTTNHSYFPIFITENYPITRDELYQKLRDKGIYSRRYFYPLISEFPMYNQILSANSRNLPVATKIASQVLCLPLSSSLSDEDIKRITSVIKDI